MLKVYKFIPPSTSTIFFLSIFKILLKFSKDNKFSDLFDIDLSP